MPRIRRCAASKKLSDLRQPADIIGRRAIDGDAPRLHGLGHLAHQLNLEQAIVEAGALHLYVVRQVELPLERPG